MHQLIHGHFRIQVLDKLRTTVQTIDSMERKTCEVHYDGRVERKTRTTDVEEEDKDDGGGGVALIEVDSSGSSVVVVVVVVVIMGIVRIAIVT